MAVTISLAENGYLAPIHYSGGAVEADGSDKNLTVNSVAAIVTPSDPADIAATKFILPVPPDDENWGGNTIIIKVFADPSGENNITITGDGNVNIDGGSTDIIIDEINTTISLYYVNETIGWMAGPANF